MAGLHHDWEKDAIDNCGTIGGKHPQPHDLMKFI
jgi:hypothetical protein